MVLNTQQLRYLVEIERTRSVSQAASNLYMGQPNLSRILRDAETALGFSIFERTRKGVRPTEKGLILLQHARNILREADFIEQLGPNHARSNRFRICLPRSHGYMEQVTKFLKARTPSEKLDASIRECHPRQALEQLDSGSAEVAVIRYCVEYQDYFSEQATQRKLTMIPLKALEYQVVMSMDHPLASKSSISQKTLERYPEIWHRDRFYPSTTEDGTHYRIYSVDRMAQLQLLQAMPSSFMWAEPLSEYVLSACRLVQRPCEDGGIRYQDMLVYKPQCAMSEPEKMFLKWMTGEEVICQN